ncbi:energy transducer TonB [Hydrogenophaga sp. A37]|uniref:energy transducer TonB n=1 Tax=Hydrogenophaga sp. A37 TaxID=1945864 RepID=UPI001559DF4C|nr:energy transducer TonB [Hydrogenophaga sp. A37]
MLLSPLRVLACLLPLVLLGGCAQLHKRGGYQVGTDETTLNSAEAERALSNSVLDRQIWPPLDAPLRLVKVELPKYLDHLRQRGIEGKVLLQFRVLPDGSVGDIKVIESSHKDLTELASDAVSQWKFVPPTRDGVGVSLYVRHPFVFQLQ